jgi:(p)ppGpp synthase/HD superfamily hydrolase
VPDHSPTPVTQLTSRYTRAVDVARVLHAADTRKKTDISYLAHLLSVSAIVLEHGGNEDQAIAALLHDAAEDHGGQARADAIRAEFGDTVADIVIACSDSLVEDKSDKAPWWQRKVAYLDHLAAEPADAALVSAADKLHNARAILGDYRTVGDKLWSRFNSDAGIAGSLWYYTRLTEILTERLTGTPGASLAAELDRTVGEITAHANALDHPVEHHLAEARTREAEIRAAINTTSVPHSASPSPPHPAQHHARRVGHAAGEVEVEP